MFNSQGSIILLFSAFLSIVVSQADSANIFKADFAPQQGLVSPYEKPCRDEICLNGLWQFQPVDLPADYSISNGAPELNMPNDTGWDTTPIRIPSPWNVNSFSTGGGGDFRCFPSYPKSWEKAEMGWLKKTFNVPGSWNGKRVFIDFESIAGDARVYVNGVKAADQFDIFLPLRVDITNLIKWNDVNTILVGVRKPSLFDIPGKMGRWTYPTGSFWGMHVAGIWQDVFLHAEPMVRISDAFVKPIVDKDNLRVDIDIKNHNPADLKLTISGAVYPMIRKFAGSIISKPEPLLKISNKHVMEFAPKSIELKSGKVSSLVLQNQVLNRLKKWSPSSPNLYGVVIEIRADDKLIDKKFIRFGWRQFGISGKSLMLNGKPIQAKGDAWHFMGVPQMTRRYAWSWFKAIKDANGNAVRPHAQVYPRFYLDVADEMGIMVLDESAIWASHCGFNYEEPVTWERFESHATALVRRDRNHPSVFGWSVANEINAALGVVKASGEQVAEIDDKIASIVNKMYEIDPTRPWISSDGDEDMSGRLKTAIGHYGGPDYCVRLGELGKPYGIGEATAAYYGTPREVSQFNGERAYESFEGRMEGLAIESYDLLANYQRKDAAYCSVFNLAWYALKPLPIGLSDTKRPPELTDGIFFPIYEEGKPGIQPERLGPYCSTFNPGYDPSLPLYETWPMFDAIKAAYAPVPESSVWNAKRTDPPAADISSDGNINKVSFFGDISGGLAFGLIRSGIKLVDAINDDTKLLIIDGKTVDKDVLEVASAKIIDFCKNSGTLMVWGLSPDRIDMINRLLPRPVKLTDRSAVSLIARKNAITADMRLSDLYFAEQPFGSVVLPNGIEGPFVNEGTVLLEACNTDWRKWNGQGENIKTAAVVRSEREDKPSGAAMVEMASGVAGKIIICNLDLSAATPKHTELIRRLMSNMDVKLSDPVAMQGGVFDSAGVLKQALVIGSFQSESDKAAYETDFLNMPTSEIKPKIGDKIGELSWQVKNANEKMIMDINKMGLPGSNMNCAAYISFWVYSPRPLDQLLAQPNVPRVDIIAGADDSMRMWLNGNALIEEFSIHPLNPEQHRISGLALKQGWNHFLVKVVQGWGEWQFALRMQCSDPIFLTSMRASVESPE